jgi:hypothetical protein
VSLSIMIPRLYSLPRACRANLNRATDRWLNFIAR